VFPSHEPIATPSSREQYAARLPILTVDGLRTRVRRAARLCTRPGLMGKRAYDLLHARGTTHHPQQDLAQQVPSMAPRFRSGRVRSPSRFKCSSPMWLPFTILITLSCLSETSPEQDAALIHAYNSSPNRSHYRGVSRNCADFVKDVINFYYPKALHRSVIADVGITTPKQLARTLVRYSGYHPELQLSKLVIVQIPGSLPRSTAVHGVMGLSLHRRNTSCPVPW
jgi:hypothetical protein